MELIVVCIVFVIVLVIGALFLFWKILGKQDEEIEAENELLKKEREKKIQAKERLETISANRTKELVRKNSKKIADLMALNNSMKFHNVRESFEIRKRYDNKSSYEKISPAFLMSADIRENIDVYAKYITQIRENREQFKIYCKKANEVQQKEYSIEADSVKMPLDRYREYEKRIFNEIKLKPIVDCTYRVRMFYSSPKRQVNLRKEGVFNFDDMFACYESVSRSHLDRDTYKKLAAVERGEVSDSLRYDILNRDNFTCVLCGASAKQGVRLHVDHIIPIAKGGKSIPDNLRTLCERCNVGKSDKIEGNLQNIESDSKIPVCKWCGAPLVLRKGKNGEFYGCSNYPKCRYTKAK